MKGKGMTEAEALYRTAMRLQRAGLILDRTALSPAHRRAALRRRHDRQLGNL